MKISLIVTLDTECDKGEGWRVQQPLCFKNILDGVPNRLTPIFDRWGIRPTYLLSPEVIADDASASLFGELMGKAELGTHLHSEFIKPYSRPDAEETTSFQSDFTPDVEFAKLENLTRLFEERFGMKPRSFRGGRYGISSHTLPFLERLGYAVDSSVTPYMWWWRRRGEGVNFLGAPEQPYYPDRFDFRRCGDMKIVEVPVSIVNRFWGRFPLAVLRMINPMQRLQTIAINTLLKRQTSCEWIRPTFASAHTMMGVTDYLALRSELGHVVVCMMFHSNEATAGTSPYNRDEGELHAFLARLEEYFHLLFSCYEVRSIGLSEVAGECR